MNVEDHIFDRIQKVQHNIDTIKYAPNEMEQHKGRLKELWHIVKCMGWMNSEEEE